MGSIREIKPKGLRWKAKTERKRVDCIGLNTPVYCRSTVSPILDFPASPSANTNTLPAFLCIGNISPFTKESVAGLLLIYDHNITEFRGWFFKVLRTRELLPTPSSRLPPLPSFPPPANSSENSSTWTECGRGVVKYRKKVRVKSEFRSNFFVFQSSWMGAERSDE